MIFKPVEISDLKPVFSGNEEIAYRDPACFYQNGTFFLFMTVSHKKNGYLYNTIGLSESKDLINWTKPEIITEYNTETNYCSPGNVLKTPDEYIICFTSYPMPFPYEVQHYANENARLYLMRTKDFKNFSSPELICAKGNIPEKDLGRMIDPFIFRDINEPNLYHLVYKQNGMSKSHSCNLTNWIYDGHIEAGENACVITEDNKYILIHSPENGIGIKTSSDLVTWTDCGISTLGQKSWFWADGRITAGYALEAPENYGFKYILFFHGSRKDSYPETHGAASIAIAFTDDFKNYFCIQN